MALRKSLLRGACLKSSSDFLANSVFLFKLILSNSFANSAFRSLKDDWFHGEDCFVRLLMSFSSSDEAHLAHTKVESSLRIWQ